MKYRRKVTIVEPEQFQFDQATRGACYCNARPGVHVHTIHGQAADIKTGDWIMPEPDGIHFYPCAPEVFAATYEPVEEFDATNIPTFESELTSLLNRFGMETMGRGGNTPDFMLATFILGVLKVYNDAIEAREKWFSSNDPAEEPPATGTTKEPPKVRLPLRFPDRPILPQGDAHFDGPKPAEERKPELAPPPLSDFVG